MRTSEECVSTFFALGRCGHIGVRVGQGFTYVSVDFLDIGHTLIGCYCLMQAYVLIGLIPGTERWKMQRLVSNMATIFAL